MPLCIPTLPSSFRQFLAPSLRTIPTSRSHAIGCSNSNFDLQFGFAVKILPLEVDCFGLGNRKRKHSAGINGLNSMLDESNDGAGKKRNVIEHILLLRAKTNLSDVEEKDMLDNLYTSQYQTRGIIAISLGRIEEPNNDKFTHAVYMRFRTKEDLEKFYVNSYYSRVLKEHVMPYCYVCFGMRLLRWTMNLK